MIIEKCIFCKKQFQIPVENLEEGEGCTLDCSWCKRQMIIKNNALVDFNKYLQVIYGGVGVSIKEDEDYTKTYIDI